MQNLLLFGSGGRRSDYRDVAWSWPALFSRNDGVLAMERLTLNLDELEAKSKAREVATNYRG